MDLNTIWFILIVVLLTGYAILDGFDLGVGAIHLFSRTDEERRTLMNAIGPVWDGNEVWLVTGGGALFAAFPDVYATVFSGFYLAFILLLFCLIMRAVSLEFRSKESFPWWRALWDGAFSLGSALASLVFGIALGNIAWGIPIGADKEYLGTFLGLFHPYALLFGVTTLLIFATHGSIYAAIKTEGDFQNRIRRWAAVLGGAAFVVLTTLIVFTIQGVPHLIEGMKSRPISFLFLGLTGVAVAGALIALMKKREGWAFFFSSLLIASLMGAFASGTYPNLVYSNPLPENSLNAWNAASSPKTLSIMLLIAGIGMPLVIAYTIVIYRLFSGKVRLDTRSY